MWRHYTRLLSRSILGSSWRFKSWENNFTNRFIIPLIMFTFHQGLKIQIIRPDIDLLSLELPSAIFTLLNVYTCDVKVTWSQSKFWEQMTHEAVFRTVFPATIGTKRHSKHLVSISRCYLWHLDGIPKKWPFNRQLPLKFPSDAFLWCFIKNVAR